MPWRRDRLPTPAFSGCPCGSAGKESALNAGDLGSIPGLGRSPGEGKGYSLQYSSLENSMECIGHGSQRVGHDWVTFTLVQKETHLNVRLKTLQQSSLPPGPGSLEKRDTKAVMPPDCSAASALMKYLLLVSKTFLRSYTDLDPWIPRRYRIMCAVFAPLGRTTNQPNWKKYVTSVWYSEQ